MRDYIRKMRTSKLTNWHLLLPPWWNFRSPCGCMYVQAIEEEDLHKGSFKNNPHKFFILNSHLTVIYLKFIKSTYFYKLKKKNWIIVFSIFSIISTCIKIKRPFNCIKGLICRCGFLSGKKANIKKKTYLPVNLAFQNLLKNKHYYLQRSLEIYFFCRILIYNNM